MSQSTVSDETEHIDADRKERLVVILHMKRIRMIFYYIFGVALFLIGLIFNITSAGHIIPYSFISWTIGITTMIVGSVFVIYPEYLRRSKVYIITTWNVRIRYGIFNRHSKRVFFDEIESVDCTEMGDSDHKMGDVEIYTSNGQTEPELLFDDIHNPDGIREIIMRFIETTPSPVPWSHIEKTREIPY